MHRFWTLLLVLAALAISGCSSVKMIFYKDASASLSTHATYNWAEEKVGLYVDPESNDRFVGGYIQLAAESELTAQGVEKSAQPDLLIGYHVSLDRDLSEALFRERYDYTYADQYLAGNAPGIWRPEPVNLQTDMVMFGRGTLVLDVFDASSRRLLWRGAIGTELDMAQSRLERDVRIQDAVRQLLTGYRR